MVHAPISTLVAPPHLPPAVLAHLRRIQRLLQRNGIASEVPVLQQSRLQYCKRLAWADEAPVAERASCRPFVSAALIYTRLPFVLVLATLRPAVIALAEPPHPFIALPHVSSSIVNTSVLGGVELCIDVWQLILQEARAVDDSPKSAASRILDSLIHDLPCYFGMASHGPCSVHIQETFFWLRQATL